MFDHLSLGVSNLTLSLAFYDSALKPLGISQMFALKDRGIAAYSGTGGVTFWLYAKDSADNALSNLTIPPRFHLAFKADNRAAVDAFYHNAIKNGGVDEGAPGIRTQYHPNYYAAYVFDPDGYKLEVVCHK
jgi:catechol 2,3-dioxygenase-like lactoylglutathione lyase family enzyme